MTFAVPVNFLVTGPPRSAKTAALGRVRDRVEAVAGGVLAPECRVDGDRVGFDLVDVFGGDRAAMARVDRDSAPGVGDYRVDVPTVDAVVARAFDRPGVEYYLVDEIAPMETRSDAFVRRVRELLDDSVPVVAAVHDGADHGFVAETRSREDGTLYDLTTRSVEAVVDEVAAGVSEALDG
ncbi:MAG: nucleoside-triphosphatase [Halolamina sp.]